MTNKVFIHIINSTKINLGLFYYQMLILHYLLGRLLIKNSLLLITWPFNKAFFLTLFKLKSVRPFLETVSFSLESQNSYYISLSKPFMFLYTIFEARRLGLLTVIFVASWRIRLIKGDS